MSLHGLQPNLAGLANASPSELSQLQNMTPQQIAQLQRLFPQGGGINNPTIGTGTAFNELVVAMMQIFANAQADRATVGQGLFSSVLDRDLALRRDPMSIVERLALGSKIGTSSPFSQATQSQVNKFGAQQQSGDLLRNLMEGLTEFAGGANASGGVLGLAHGGSLKLDPNRARSSGTAIAAPVTLTDRTGKTVAVAGEGGTEDVVFKPRGTSASSATNQAALNDPRIQAAIDAFGTKGVVGLGQASQAVTDEKGLTAKTANTVVLRADEQFRLEEVQRFYAQLGIPVPMNKMIELAKNPAEFDRVLRFIGIEGLDPARQATSRLIGGQVAGDDRFSESLRRELSVGRVPLANQINAFDAATFSPDQASAFQSLIGPDSFNQFLFEILKGTPAGLRTRSTGGVRF